MLAIDTNVIVRFLTRDDPEQARRAGDIIERDTVFVSSTVLLETEWVLRSAYGFAKARVIEALARFVGMPTVRLDEPARIAAALSWAQGGIDFADALHLAAAGACDGFVSFDRRLTIAAASLGVEVRQP